MTQHLGGMLFKIPDIMNFLWKTPKNLAHKLKVETVSVQPIASTDESIEVICHFR
jgi:hypothetical protein